MSANIALRLTLAGMLFHSSASLLCAQQQTAAVNRQAIIEIGQPIADTVATLRFRGIGWSDQAGEVTRMNDDVGYLWFNLDEQHSYAEVFYSKSQQKVTGISLVFFPPGYHTKSTRSHVSAEGIRLEADGSYAVHFSRPIKKDHRVPSPQHEFPSSAK